MIKQQKIRTFIATIPDQAARQTLIAACASLKSQLPESRIRWVPESNLHITLRFLGDLSHANINHLKTALSGKLVDCRSFEVLFEKIDWFPSPSQPYALAATFCNTPQLQALAMHAELAAQTIGLPPEKRTFRGHLTVARCRLAKPAPRITPAPLDQQRISVTQVVLFQSRLSAEGPRYTPLFCLPLHTQ